MYIPNGFTPSEVNRRKYYDPEGRLKSFSIARQSEGGIAEANSLFATDAEAFGSCAPFLKKNKIRDAKRRNYIVQPGGATVYFSDAEVPGELPSRTGFPSPGTQLGHDSLDATNQANAGVNFTVGIPSPRNGE